MSKAPAYLWVTRERPFAPNYGGDWLYSSRMIRSVAEAGAEVTVLCHAKGGPPPEDFPARVRWRLGDAPPRRSGAALLLSPLPAIAARHGGGEMRALLGAALRERPWDAVIIDHIAAGWAVSAVKKAGLRVVYLSHNHEASARRSAARSAAAPPWKRAVLMVDAAKVAPLERQLLEAASLVGANTDVDAALFAREHPDRRYLLLAPGHDGPTSPPRDPQALPRAAVVVGSFGWIAKQSNLLRFLGLAVRPFTDAGAELMVVGTMPAQFQALLARRFPSVKVTGAVDDVAPWLARARIGVIAEEIGGGFKHKALSYVFNRLPIAALDGSCVGLPLTPGDGILSFADMPGLVAGTLAAIDDVPRLRRLEAAALGACEGRFDWADRGRALVGALGDGRP